MGLWKVNNGGRDKYTRCVMGNMIRKVDWLQKVVSVREVYGTLAVVSLAG